MLFADVITLIAMASMWGMAGCTFLGRGFIPLRIFTVACAAAFTLGMAPCLRV